MELRHLRYFVAIAEARSIRRASEQVHITQPALSRQLQDLECELGFKLFDRHPRGLELTAAGQFLLKNVQSIMGDLEHSILSASRIAAGTQGHLRIGFVENSSWGGIVPETLQRFQLEVPNASIELIPLNTPEQIQRIEHGELDGGFIYEYQPLSNSCTVLHLLNHGVVLAVPAAWKTPVGSVSLTSVADLPFITFPRWTYPAYHGQLMAACGNLGVILRVVQEEPTESAILSLVGAGIGVALVNSANLGRQPTSVRFLELTDLAIQMPLGFAYRTNNGPVLLQRFLQVLNDALQASVSP